MPTRNDDFNRPLPAVPEINQGEVFQQHGQVTPEPKPWYQSKTIWFNAAVVVASVAAKAVPALEGFMNAETYSVIASGVAFVNAALRLATGRPIKTYRN